MKCPVCNEEVSELDESCPHCQINFADFLRENNRTNEKERTNADCLNTMANVNVVLSIIISAILIFPNLVEVSARINGYSIDSSALTAIVLGIVCLILGITLCFFLKTIADIYKKVEN